MPSTGDRLRTTEMIRLAARGGSADRLRIVASALVSAVMAVALLSVVSVASVQETNGPYDSELLMQPGLRIGLIVALVLISVLLGVLTGQCARIGAPDRDRRLAAYRMAGATPRDVRRIVAAETGMAAAVGSMVGTAVFLVGRPGLDNQTTVTGDYQRTRQISPDTVTMETVRGQVHLLPTDVQLPAWAVLAIVIGLPLAVTALSLVALRRVVVSPFGVVRRSDVRTPRLLPAVLFVAGAGTLFGFSALSKVLGINEPSPVAICLVILSGLVAGAGLVWGAATMSALLGATLAPRTSKPSILIAARRLKAEPFSTSREIAVVLLVLLIGGFIQGFGAWINVAAPPSENGSHQQMMTLVNAALAVSVTLALLGILITTGEAVVTARRSLSALVATGVPRKVLRRSLLLEAMLPLVLTAPAAVATGLFAARGVLGTEDVQSRGTVDKETLVHLAIPIPWTAAGLLVAGAIVAAAAMAWLALTVVDASTDPAELRTTA